MTSFCISEGCGQRCHLGTSRRTVHPGFLSVSLLQFCQFENGGATALFLFPCWKLFSLGLSLPGSVRAICSEVKKKAAFSTVTQNTSQWLLKVRDRLPASSWLLCLVSHKVTRCLGWVTVPFTEKHHTQALAEEAELIATDWQSDLWRQTPGWWNTFQKALQHSAKHKSGQRKHELTLEAKHKERRALRMGGEVSVFPKPSSREPNRYFAQKSSKTG